MVHTIIRTYVLDESFSYFVPELWGGEHTFKAGGGISCNQMRPADDGGLRHVPVPRRCAVRSRTTRPPIPSSSTSPSDPSGVNGFDVFSRDRRYYFFVEDKWRVANNLTLNLGLRYDNQRQTPATSDAFAPRLGFAWDVFGSGKTVIRGGVGKFYAYVPVVLDLTHQQRPSSRSSPRSRSAIRLSPVLRPDMITDSAGNPGVAVLSAAGQAELNRLRGTAFNRNPRVDSDDRQLPYQWSWSVGVSHQLFANAAVSVDYVANASRDQLGVVDINEPVNRRPARRRRLRSRRRADSA